jgi:hypothetical protein
MLANSDVLAYTVTTGREAPVKGPFKEVIDRWAADDAQKPKKKRRTARRMYDLLRTPSPVPRPRSYSKSWMTVAAAPPRWSHPIPGCRLA